MTILKAERATAERLKGFGTLVGAVPDATQTMEFGTARIFGEIPFVLAGTPELLVCRLDPREMKCTLMERHFRHTQTYIPMNGKPFVMVLGPDTPGDMPVLEELRAFHFDDACGISINTGVWHEFPFAIENDTRFAVALVRECHVNRNSEPAFAGDADGPDLQRRSFSNRIGLNVHVTF